MDQVKLFISYSHADEWLKDELVKHLAALKHRGLIDVWHDRLIPAGGVLDDEIDAQIRTAHVVLLLVSNDFMASNYCLNTEYRIALERRDLGEAIVIPVLVRDCDWDAKRLKTFNALPPDAIAVTRGAGSRSDAQLRDASWVKVIEGLKPLIEELKKSLEAPSLTDHYLSKLFVLDRIKHPLVSVIDERSIFVDPDVYLENRAEQLVNFASVVELIKTGNTAAIFTGSDRSGKSLTAKMLQLRLTEGGLPAIRIDGCQIRNADFQKIFRRQIEDQLDRPAFPLSRVTIIVDNFEECTLNDKVKEDMVEYIDAKCGGLVIFSFSNAPAVLFASKELAEPYVLNINPITSDKLLILVRKWKQVGIEGANAVNDDVVLPTFERLQLVFAQTDIPKSPCSAVVFLEILENSSGADIAFSSFAACYDTMINNRLNANGIDWRSVDECKNFLSLLSYKAYTQSGTCLLSRESFEECISIFEEQFLSSSARLRSATIGLFILANEKGDFIFVEEYIWYFLCARYVSNQLKSLDSKAYRDFVQKCTKNIFEKKYANIVIFIAYFSADNFVLESLLTVLDGLFSKADDWLLSDDTRDIMVGTRFSDPLKLESRADVEENRMALLREKIFDIINDALRVVARYTLPFLNSDVADSIYVETVDIYKIDADSYMRNVNALMRIHSVVGQILTGRSGTYNTNLVLDCITRMVKASGRYASLNHAIATVLLYDQEKSREEVRQANKLSDKQLDEQYEKVIRIFSFWSVYISHAGLARYLSQEHSIRALAKLSEQFESEKSKTGKGNIPFNFTTVLLIAKLYESGKIDKDAIEAAVEKYGEHSSLFNILRVVFHIYTYYMPVSIGDKQWISNKLKMSLKKLEVQRVKAGDIKRLPSRKESKR